MSVGLSRALTFRFAITSAPKGNPCSAVTAALAVTTLRRALATPLRSPAATPARFVCVSASARADRGIAGQRTHARRPYPSGGSTCAKRATQSTDYVIIHGGMRLHDARHRLLAALLALATPLAACARTSGTSDTIPDDVEHPWHPTCREACEGHCDAEPEACRERCDRDCAPAIEAATPSG